MPFLHFPSRDMSFSTASINLCIGVNVVRSGSPSRIRMVRRISFGMTTRPRSSILLTIPVAFIYKSPLLQIFSVISLFAECNTNVYKKGRKYTSGVRNKILQKIRKNHFRLSAYFFTTTLLSAISKQKPHTSLCTAFLYCFVLHRKTVESDYFIFAAMSSRIFQ